MLTFLRTHQKTVLIAVTGAVVISFFFFGLSEGGGLRAKNKENPLGKALDGSAITKERVERMARFLSNGHFDFLDDKALSPNWLNDGVLEKDFINAPIGPILAEKIFPKIEPELSGIVEKAKSFTPYRHPYAPFLGALALWSQFAPEATDIASNIIQTKDKASLQTFRWLSDLYLKQKSIPLTFFKRMIFYQQNQDGRVKEDDRLPYADLSLLGLHSAKEWFGSTYLQAASQVIINAAAYAKARGLTVSMAQVREQLLFNVSEGAKKAGESIPKEHLYGAFLQQVRKEGMEEKECLDLWKDIVLFRKLRTFFADSLSLDPDLLQKAHDSSKDLATIELFFLPPCLEFKDFLSLLKLQVYMEAVSHTPKKEPFLLGAQLLPFSEVEKKIPELVRQEYTLEYSEFDTTKGAGQVGLKEMWAWQTADLGWSYLEKRFSFLEKSKAISRESRLAALEELEDEKRGEVDTFSKQTILSLDKTRIDKAMGSFQVKQETVLVGSQGEGLPFKGIGDKLKLKDLLEIAPLKTEFSSDPLALAAKDKLLFYTEDEQHYYKISVIRRSLDKKLLTFAEAEALGILRENLEKRLQTIYPVIRKKEPTAYLQKDGSWKPLAQVREKVGLSLFPELFQSIIENYNAFTGKEATLEEKNSPSFYVEYFPLCFVKAMVEQIKNPAPEEMRSFFAKQWDLQSEVKTVGKERSDIFASEEEFFLDPGRYSPIHFSPGGKNLFFKVIDRSEREKLPDAEIEAIKAPLRKEAEEKGFFSLFEKIEEKKALYLDTPL